MTSPRLPQIASALAWGSLALLAYLLFLVVRPFLVPLGWGCVLAVLVYPAHARVAARVGPSRAASLTTFATAAILIAPAVYVTVAFAREMVSIAGSLQGAITNGRVTDFQEWLQRLVARLPFLADTDVAGLTDDALRRAATFLASQSGALLTNIAVFFVDLVLALFTTFFLLRDAKAVMRGIRRLLPMGAPEREAFISRTADLITAGVTSSAIVATLQGLLGGIAFALVGLPAPVFWGVVMGFACLLPFGAGIIYLPAAAILAAEGSVTKGLVLAGLGIGVISMVDNIVRPLLLSERVHMNGLVVFVSLLGGLSVFGLLGIVLGPIIVVTALALVTSYVEAVPEDDPVVRT